MKIILAAINAKYIHSNLAVYSLKTYAENKIAECGLKDKLRADGDLTGDTIQICEYTINNRTDDILQDIFLKKPDLIAFSCYIWNISIIKELIKELRKVLTGADIFAGGPEVSYVASEFLSENGGCLGVMVGEGEKIFSNLCIEYMTGRKKLENISGLVYRNADNRIIKTPPETLLDLNDIPFAYNNLDEFENKIIYYESSRGCPYSCSYCLSSIDRTVRFRNVDTVKRELKVFMDNRAAQVKFVDRTFNCKKSHAIEIWRYIYDNDNGVTNFHFEIAADILSEEEIKILNKMRPGLVQLEIGVQSTNEKTLCSINRKTNLTKLKNNVAKIRIGNNIHQHLDLIAGLPFEDYKSFANSFNDVYAMRPDQLQLGFLKLLWGSEMRRSDELFKIVCRETPPYEVLYTDWISYDEILKLKSLEEAVEIYYNSGQFSNTVRHLERFFDTAFEMYEKIGAYYKQNCVKGAKHNRIDRYKILLQFIIDAVGHEEIFKELLILDLYLRENIKTRPDFAKDLRPFTDEIKDIYAEEVKERKLLPDYEEYSYRQMLKATHIEVFSRDMQKLIETGIDEPCKQIILFDYKNKNVLNGNAETIII